MKNIIKFKMQFTMKICENYYSFQYLKQKFAITPLLMLFAALEEQTNTNQTVLKHY